MTSQDLGPVKKKIALNTGAFILTISWMFYFLFGPDFLSRTRWIVLVSIETMRIFPEPPSPAGDAPHPVEMWMGGGGGVNPEKRNSLQKQTSLFINLPRPEHHTNVTTL